MRKIDLASIHELFFKDFGFKFIESLMLFEKKFPHGKQVVFVHYTDFSDQSFLEYKLGVRIDRVEMIIHKFLPTIKDYAERSITMIQTLNKIGKKLPKRFVIENNWELSEAIMKTESFFITDGFKWLDEMINPMKLERAFITQRNNSFKTQNFVYNAFRATALCKIYNPNDYPEVRKKFLMQIEETNMTPFTLASFLQFLNYLDNLD